VVEEQMLFLIKAVGGCVLFIGSGALLYWLRRSKSRGSTSSSQS
jgi:hypothetical protein